MKFGITFPQLEIGQDMIVICDYVQAIESMGFDFLLAYDHILGVDRNRPEGWKGRYDSNDMFHEPFTLFSYLAAITQTIEFATGILISPQRATALIAKQAAQVDVMSNGRLRLGIGIGWNKVEYDAQGFNFRDRAKRIEEQVAVMRQLWQHEIVNFQGQYHTIENAGLNPLPVQRPIPIWFGGGTEDPILKRIATLGDGWIVNIYDLDVAKDAVNRIHQFLQEAGRTPEAFGFDVGINIGKMPPDTWQNYVEGWQQLGMTHLRLNTMDAGFSSIDEHLKAIEQFKAFADGL